MCFYLVMLFNGRGMGAMKGSEIAARFHRTTSLPKREQNDARTRSPAQGLLLMAGSGSTSSKHNLPIGILHAH